jgi:hypothetical protein
MNRFATMAGVVAVGVALATAGAGVSIALAGATPDPYGVQAVPAAPVNVERPEPLDLSSLDAINQHLRSRGFDPSTFVVQRGARNYAGPNCPGLGWNCTTATQVVQIAAGGAVALSSFSTLDDSITVNEAECVPESDPLPEDLPAGAVGCVIVQTALVGPEVDQQASCKVESTVPKKQLCDIMQENTTGGDNQATISMKIDSNVGTTQLADQEALADQETAGGGNNQFQADQTIVLAAQGSPTTQDGYQSVDFRQDVFELSVSTLLDDVPASGNNQAQVTQTQNLTAYAPAGGTQEQNVGTALAGDPCRGAVEDANSCVEYDQDTGSGTNQIEVNQRHDLKATSAKSNVTQVQGCDPMNPDKPCGLEEVGSQQTDEESTNEEAKNRAAVVQNGTYVLEAPDGMGLVQIQDPHFGGAESEQCCSEDDKFTLDQLAVLRAADNPPPPATPPTLVQSHENFVDDQSIAGDVLTKSTIVLNDEQPSVVTCSSGEGDLRRCTYEQHCSNAPPPGTFCPRNGETAVPPETIETGD